MIHHYGMYGGGVGPFFVLGGLFHFLFWLFVIILVIRVIKHKKHHGWHRMWEDRGATGILRERFARGEISKEEYEEKIKVLEK